MTQSSGQQRDRLKYFRATTTSSRRKWSDWSECSESCLRTRHRLNCDDLLGEELPTTGRQVHERGRGAAKQVASKSEPSGRKLQVRSEKNLPATASKDLGQPNDDDQDYADEGDEDDEDDSCANVEPSETFQEQSCLGGQCKQLPAASDIFRLGPASQQGQAGHHQTSSGRSQVAQRPRAGSKAAPANGYGAAESDGRPLQAARPLLAGPNIDSENQAKQRPPESAERTVVNQTATTTALHKDLASRAQIELDRAASGTATLTAAGDSARPFGMWNGSTGAGPTKLAASGGPEIRWAPASLTAGACLLLVAAIGLLVRRLFVKSRATKAASYDWMLAASQRRDSSGRLLCCHHSAAEHPPPHGLFGPAIAGHHRRLGCSSVAKLSSASGATVVTTEALQEDFLVSQRLAETAGGDRQKQPLCYLWPRQQEPSPSAKSSSFAASLGHLAQQFGPSKSQKLDYKGSKQPFFVDSDGRHLSVRSQLQTGGGGSATSSSTRSANIMSPTSSAQQNRRQLLFDALYVEPNIVQNLAHLQNGHPDYDQLYQYDTLDLVASRLSPRGSSKLNSAGQPTDGNLMKKQPPKVPSSATCSAGRGAQRDDGGDESHSASLSGSLGRRPSSGQSSFASGQSSGSIQSATAQLLSNEANSSLDQAPDLLDSPDGGPGSPPQPPRTETHTRKAPHLASAARLAASSSQPNSPRCAASDKRRQFQLAHAASNRRKKSTKRARGEQTQSECDSGGRATANQQHFYEEIGRS